MTDEEWEAQYLAFRLFVTGKTFQHANRLNSSHKFTADELFRSFLENPLTRECEPNSAMAVALRAFGLTHKDRGHIARAARRLKGEHNVPAHTADDQT